MSLKLRKSSIPEEFKVDAPSPSPSLESRNIPCVVCEADSTGNHFGVDACSACSAFFRRAVVLNHVYKCYRNGKCNISRLDGRRQKCRACRFAKCEAVGMNKNSVQNKRDSIGRYRMEKSQSSEETETPIFSPATPTPSCSWSSESRVSLLDELRNVQTDVNRTRRLYYSRKSGKELFSDETEFVIRDLDNYDLCMAELFQTEPRLAIQFLEKTQLRYLPPNVKFSIFRNFYILRQAIEEPYLTYKLGGRERNWWILSNRTYLDLENTTKYWSSGILDSLKLSNKEVESLFYESYRNAISSICKAMAEHQITETEMLFLFGIALYDPTLPGLSEEVRENLLQQRNQLLSEIFSHYEEICENQEIRFANLIMILNLAKVRAIKTQEDMHLIDTFQLCSVDRFFTDICRGNFDDEPVAMEAS